MHDRVDDPEPPEIVGLEREHDRFEESVITPRETVPLKPFKDPTVIVEFPGTPVFAETPDGLDPIVKSWLEVT